MLVTRRSFAFGLGALLAAPAIVRASSIMPVRSLKVDRVVQTYGELLKIDGRVMKGTVLLLGNRDASKNGVYRIESGVWRRDPRAFSIAV